MHTLVAVTVPVSSRRPATRLVTVAVVVVAAAEVAAELVYLWRESRRAAAGWWDRVQLRERRRLCETELGLLSRRLDRRR